MPLFTIAIGLLDGFNPCAMWVLLFLLSLLQDFFAWHRGLSLSIPEPAKPGIYSRVRRILQADNFPVALAGIVVLAGLVNVIELLCTAGLPALYTQILTLQRLPMWSYYRYLGLYNLAYVFDDSLMVALAVVTLSRTNWRAVS
ncbi:MAG TPA: hypothetical protein VFR79_12845 [Nitrospira sp.]|nr:hypothetical protein [Nitrospira sp.]